MNIEELQTVFFRGKYSKRDRYGMSIPNDNFGLLAVAHAVAEQCAKACSKQEFKSPCTDYETGYSDACTERAAVIRALYPTDYEASYSEGCAAAMLAAAKEGA